MAKPDLILQHLQKIDVKLDRLNDQMRSSEAGFTTLESRFAAMEVWLTLNCGSPASNNALA